MALRIVMLGAPGAGKGTQAKRLEKKYGLPHISTGDIFRELAGKNTKLGEEVEEYLNAGILVPDDVVYRLVTERLDEEDCEEGYILDGFPRSLSQAVAFDARLAARDERVDLALNLDVPVDELMTRLTARRTCPECGKIYNTELEPPRVEGRCDNCSGIELVLRDDDKLETIGERLRVYHELTEPMIAFYAERGVERRVGGQHVSAGEIAAKIEEILAAVGVSAL